MIDSGVLVPITLFICGAVTAIGVPMSRAFARRMDREALGNGGLATNDIVARLERMEQAIESVAVEVERISEGQRFTTKLLSERTPADANRGNS